MTYATACDVLFWTAFVVSLAVIAVTLWEHSERIREVWAMRSAPGLSSFGSRPSRSRRSALQSLSYGETK
jgi:hypothetical protein